MDKVKSLLGWFFSVFFFLGFLSLLRSGITWLLFLVMSVINCPPLLRKMENHHKKPKLWLRIGATVVLLMIATAFMPTSEQDSNGAANVNEISADRNEAPTNGSKTDVKEAKTETDEKAIEEVKVETDEKAIEKAKADSDKTSVDKDELTSEEENKDISYTENIKNSKMMVHFIDVGQGDSILVESDGRYMLIDAGENNKGTTVVNYLKDQGVDKLDYIIGTHPHSDHIGGMDTVLNSFSVGKVIMPDTIHTTQTFEDVLDAIDKNNIKITKAKVGNQYTIGNAEFVIISPNGSDYNDLNNYSIGIKLTNGSDIFLLVGDAEAISENEMMKNGISLKADVLKLGHHGSAYSSQSNFLDQVKPKYAVVSAGEDNQYGHPHQETVQRIKDRDIPLYRTDQQGTIVFTSDGKSISVPTDKPTPKPTAKPTPTPKTSNNSGTSTTIVHITESGEKYHRAGCRYLKSDYEVTLDKALSQGLQPCKVCKPPTK